MPVPNCAYLSIYTSMHITHRIYYLTLLSSYALFYTYLYITNNMSIITTKQSNNNHRIISVSFLCKSTWKQLLSVGLLGVRGHNGLQGSIASASSTQAEKNILLLTNSQGWHLWVKFFSFFEPVIQLCARCCCWVFCWGNECSYHFILKMMIGCSCSSAAAAVSQADFWKRTKYEIRFYIVFVE